MPVKGQKKKKMKGILKIGYFNSTPFPSTCDRVCGNRPFVDEINYVIRAIKVFPSYISEFAFFMSNEAITILDHSHLL